MKNHNIFYAIFFLTILIIRIAVLIFPEYDIMIDGTIIHHFWIGIFIVLLSLVIRRYKNISLLAFSIGLGLIIDELVFMLLGAGSDIEYWSILSVISVVILIILIFFLREQIYSKLNKSISK